MIEPRPLILSLAYPSSAWAVSGIFIHRHVRALVDAGVDVRVVAPKPWLPRFLEVRERWRRFGAIKDNEGYGGVDVIRLAYVHVPGPVVRHLSFLGLGLRLASHVRSGFTGVQRNVIHAQRLYPEGLVGLIAARRLRLPLICSARGGDVHSLPYASNVHMRVARKVLRVSDAVIAVSRRLADQAGGIAACHRRIHVIYSGVECNVLDATVDKETWRHQLNLPRAGRLLLFVGRFEAAKGARELLRAFGRVRIQEPDTHLVVVGANQCGVTAAGCAPDEARGVHFVGEVAPGQVAAYIRACDVFALPSYAEGMPNALLEAMACGLPAVATDVGGIAEVIVDGVNGFMVPVGDSEQLAERLCRLVADPDLADAMGARAAAAVRGRFSWPRNAQEHIELYRDVLDRWQREGPRPRGRPSLGVAGKDVC